MEWAGLPVYYQLLVFYKKILYIYKWRRLQMQIIWAWINSCIPQYCVGANIFLYLTYLSLKPAYDIFLGCENTIKMKAREYLCEAGTSSPSHWQQVEEQAPKHVGCTMCFLLMTLVPIQKLCVNMCIYIYIYIYIYVHSLYEFCYRTYIQRECHSVFQYWRRCTPSRSIGLYFWGVRGSWAECHFLFSLVCQLCLALW